MEIPTQLVNDIAHIWTSARSLAYQQINRILIDANWEIGRRIVQEEQQGHDKAPYGAHLLDLIAEQLALQLDKSLDSRELRRMRQLYLLFPDPKTLRAELSWSHYRQLLHIQNAGARRYYLQEAADQQWSSRQLKRNIQSGFYERILKTQLLANPPASPTREQNLTTSPSTDTALSAADFIKDPFVLEFLGLPMPAAFTESDLESAILANIQQFLVELGKGFSFVGRQFCIKTDHHYFYIDLVFYNFILRCFCLLELKLGELSHQDIGQMDFYVRLFEDVKKNPGDNPTIGIILCRFKDETIVKYSVLDDSKHLFASTYRLVLPTDEELARLVDAPNQPSSPIESKS